MYRNILLLILTVIIYHCFTNDTIEHMSKRKCKNKLRKCNEKLIEYNRKLRERNRKLRECYEKCNYDDGKDDGKDDGIKDGEYTIKTGSTGKNLITTWGGDQVQSWNECNPLNAQFKNGQCKFKIEKIPDSDYYTIKTAANGKNLITTWNGDENHLGKVETWDGCTEYNAQFKNGQCKFKIEKIPDSDYYTIKTAATGKNLITTWNGDEDHLGQVQSFHDCTPSSVQFKNGQCKFKIEKI